MSDNKLPADLLPAFYSWRIHEFSVIAKSCGYALGVHGTMQRDLDLIAVPWTERAVDADVLIQRFCDGLGIQRLGSTSKPHGRLAFSLTLGGAFQADISVTPKRKPSRRNSAT